MNKHLLILLLLAGLAAAALVSGTTYWIILHVDSAGDASNYIGWHYTTGSYPGYTQTQTSAAGTTTWANFQNTTGKFTTYGQ